MSVRVNGPGPPISRYYSFDVPIDRWKTRSGPSWGRFYGLPETPFLDSMERVLYVRTCIWGVKLMGSGSRGGKGRPVCGVPPGLLFRESVY